MNVPEIRLRLRDADEPLGSERRALLLGHFALMLEGLDRTLVARLARRWGPFLVKDASGAIETWTLRLRRGGVGPWLGLTPARGPYRLESLGEKGVASDAFALGLEAEDGPWRVALSDDAEEPVERTVDNVARILAARIAAERGGFALHAAGVVRDGQAWLFAGKSRAGKTTATSLAAPARSLGDDFSMILPDHAAGWVVPALPFDNAERMTDREAGGLFPIAAVWRLYQAEETRIERPPAAMAVASLMSCGAFPWILPDLAGPLLDQARRFVASGRFAHLRFARDVALWHHLGPLSPLVPPADPR